MNAKVERDLTEKWGAKLWTPLKCSDLNSSPMHCQLDANSNNSWLS